VVKLITCSCKQCSHAASNISIPFRRLLLQLSLGPPPHTYPILYSLCLALPLKKQGPSRQTPNIPGQT